ncbi:glycosyltransferase [Mesorhizobium sp. C264A]|uniref:glycosyltransferase family 32 protein n=2 Tax=unclassified Mesorhizobium TaxID=325217 RepID=UPI0033358B9B
MRQMQSYPPGFENDETLRSTCIRQITLRQMDRSTQGAIVATSNSSSIPKTLIQYWHDHSDLPDDVRACLDSWKRLGDEGFFFRLFDDASAAEYIADWYGPREIAAFARCRHPAMRSDYLRMCFVLAEGGMYVDADDVLLGDGWRRIFDDGKLKIQPLCYDLATSRMVPASQIWGADLPTQGRVFYVNNDPIAAPARHPVLVQALARATRKLLSDDPLPEIQGTTGPGNLTLVLAAHANALTIAGYPFDFELLRDWEEIAETKWDLSYRGDARNWRNVDGSGF